MKRILIIASILFGSLASSKAQYADPYIDISMVPSSVNLGSNASLQVLLGNFGSTPVCINSMNVTISVGLNAEILALAPSGAFGISDPRWTVTFMTTGAGNTIQLQNTAGSFTDFDLDYIYLTVKGVAAGGPNNCGANIAYIIGSSPGCNGGQPYPNQGNLVVDNDNGITSLTVISLPVPDFTPTISVGSVSFPAPPASGSTKDFVVGISEGLNGASTGQVAFRIVRSSAYTITFNPVSGTSNVPGPVANNNSDWNVVTGPVFITATLKPGVIISGFGISRVGFVFTRNTGVGTNTATNFTVSILPGTGGDSNSVNNSSNIQLNAQ